MASAEGPQCIELLAALWQRPARIQNLEVTDVVPPTQLLRIVLPVGECLRTERPGRESLVPQLLPRPMVFIGVTYHTSATLGAASRAASAALFTCCQAVKVGSARTATAFGNSARRTLVSRMPGSATAGTSDGKAGATVAPATLRHTTSAPIWCTRSGRPHRPYATHCQGVNEEQFNCGAVELLSIGSYHVPGPSGAWTISWHLSPDDRSCVLA
jgi:hypothetical protein